MQYRVFIGLIFLLSVLTLTPSVQAVGVGTLLGTDIHGAAKKGKLKKVIRLVEKKGADVNLKNGSGNTPLEFAAWQGHIKVVNYLLSKGAKINEQDEAGQTALHLEVTFGRTEITKLLLDRGANINLITTKGQTPVMRAAINGRAELLELLVSQGADLNIKDMSGKSALDWAHGLKTDWPGKKAIIASLSTATASEIVARENDSTSNTQVLDKEEENTKSSVARSMKDSAHSQMEEMCSRGTNFACTSMGNKYTEGKGVQKDYRRAREYYSKACDLGDNDGCNNLGFLYVKGYGGEQDTQTAHSLFSKTCDAGLAQGCSSLALMYVEGLEVDIDLEKAFQLYAISCDLGRSEACAEAGFQKYKRKDYKVAHTYYLKACNMDYGQGCFNLGALYYNSEGVSNDAGKAKSYLRKSCDLGYKEGCRY